MCSLHTIVTLRENSGQNDVIRRASNRAIWHISWIIWICGNIWISLGQEKWHVFLKHLLQGGVFKSYSTLWVNVSSNHFTRTGKNPCWWGTFQLKNRGESHQRMVNKKELWGRKVFKNYSMMMKKFEKTWLSKLQYWNNLL